MFFSLDMFGLECMLFLVFFMRIFSHNKKKLAHDNKNGVRTMLQPIEHQSKTHNTFWHIQFLCALPNKTVWMRKPLGTRSVDIRQTSNVMPSGYGSKHVKTNPQ